MVSRSLLNIVQLGLGFFLNFFAFNSQGFIEEPVIESAAKRQNINVHAGYYSLSIIYATFTLGNFVAAPIIDILSPKWGMCLAALCYAAFQAGFLQINEIYLYISSAILGFGAAILWTGQGTYLAQNSTEKTSGRNSGLLWALSEGRITVAAPTLCIWSMLMTMTRKREKFRSVICVRSTCWTFCMCSADTVLLHLLGGGVFLFIVFHSSETTDNISTSTVRILYGVFTILACLSSLTFALLRPAQVTKVREGKPQYGRLLGSTFRLMFTKRMFLLAIVFAYTGIEQAFWTGIYPTCISFTQKLGSNTNSLLALNSISAGIGQITAGLLFGILGARTSKIGRDSIIFMGAVIHLITFALIYMNFPNDAPLQKTEQTGNVLSPSVAIALVCGLLLGFGDACWNTQIYAFLCDKFSHKSSEAFAIFKFYQSLLSCAAFFYSPYLQLSWHLLILLVTSIFAAVCFFINQRFPHLLGSDEDQNEVKTISERAARSFDSGEQIICQDTPHLSSKAAD